MCESRRCVTGMIITPIGWSFIDVIRELSLCTVVCDAEKSGDKPHVCGRRHGGGT